MKAGTIASAVLAAAVLTGCGASGDPATPGPSHTVETFEINGTLSVAGGLATNMAAGAPCSSKDYATKPGVQVLVKDAASKTIAVGALEEGALDRSQGKYLARCVYPFTVPDIPDRDAL